MAQTWRITPRKVATFRLIDALCLPLRLLLRRRRRPTGEIRNILVVEAWHIGDVVLATPLLLALRKRFPEARIALLGKQHAEELLRHSGLVDEVIVFDFPWTAKTAKYHPRRYNLGALRRLVSRLRSSRFDLTIDARMDLRSNLLTFLSRAPRRIGYDFGGGAFLLTDAVPADPNARHRVEDWLMLMRPLEQRANGVSPIDLTAERFEPALAVSDEEREAAARLLRSNGISADDVVAAIHAGASDAHRRWPTSSFQKVAERLVAVHRAKIIYFPEPGVNEPAMSGASLVLRASLREMMAILSHCRLLVCNDSGPMHIADALGVPVVAVFIAGNPEWYRPYRANQVVVAAGVGRDCLIAPQEKEVIKAAEQQLERALTEPDFIRGERAVKAETLDRLPAGAPRG